jgi:hypothetical protein
MQVSFPDKKHVWEYDQQGQLRQEVIQIGRDEYKRLSENPPLWHHRVRSASLKVGPSEGAASRDIIDGAMRFLRDVAIVGHETLNGVQVVHLRGMTDMPAKADFNWPNWESWTPDEREGAEGPRSQFLQGTEQVDLWIDEEKGFLLLQQIYSQFPTAGTTEENKEEGYTADGIFEFSRYNDSFDITPPSSEQVLPDSTS